MGGVLRKEAERMVWKIQRFIYLLIWPHSDLFIYLFIWPYGMWKVLGQGSITCHSRGLCHSWGNAGSLTCCAAQGLLRLRFGSSSEEQTGPLLAQ